jgi:glycosyltransferase involved in cell wall biosynthesis
MRPLRIAMVGSRGVPATFGGVERHVEELGARLVERGHEVVVYTRPHYNGDVELTEHRGMRLVELPTVRRRGMEAFVHSGLASLATVGRGFDVVHFHALGPGLFTPVPRGLTRAGVVQTIHGLDDERAKWGGGAQRLLRLGGKLSARVPHEVVVVSQDLRRHYGERHGRATTYIPNGVPEPVPTTEATLREHFGLEDRGYLMFLGRLVPEKEPELLLRAFRRVPTDLKLVVVGDSSGTDDYTAALRELGRRDDRVVFAGFQYGEALAALLGHAALFVQPSRLEGLPITLLEAAAYGRPVVASDIAPHVEVVGASGPGRMLFESGSEESLVDALARSLKDPDAVRDGAAQLHDDVVRRYSWDWATDQLEETYLRALAARRHS